MRIFEAALLISVVSAIGDLGGTARLPNAIVQDATASGASTVTSALWADTSPSLPPSMSIMARPSASSSSAILRFERPPPIH